MNGYGTEVIALVVTGSNLLIRASAVLLCLGNCCNYFLRPMGT
jgi:hypothetical protein